VGERTSDDDESEWPDDGAEAAFLSENRDRGEVPSLEETAAAAPPAGEKLPALEDLVAKVPENIRNALDDLFRAKFTAVRRFSAARES
jgi:hypothetical protein